MKFKWSLWGLSNTGTPNRAYFSTKTMRINNQENVFNVKPVAYFVLTTKLTFPRKSRLSLCLLIVYITKTGNVQMWTQCRKCFSSTKYHQQKVEGTEPDDVEEWLSKHLNLRTQQGNCPWSLKGTELPNSYNCHFLYLPLILTRLLYFVKTIRIVALCFYFEGADCLHSSSFFLRLWEEISPPPQPLKIHPNVETPEKKRKDINDVKKKILGPIIF